MPARKTFPGFGDSETFTPIPDTFLRDLLRDITDAAELKVVLHALWSVEHMDSAIKALSAQDFSAADLGLNAEHVALGLESALKRGVLLRAGRGNSSRYFLNTPRGRAAARALDQGKALDTGAVSLMPLERPNVFRLYEENIGPLTPLIADALKDAEESFPGEWIEQAIDLAAKNNKRSWSYCQAILKRWKEEGRGQKQNRRDNQATRQRDVEEKIRKFIRG
ncbi:MAG TPA: DnaD domain protein [Anaerolineales bacterium]|nr:DnaD domain protein [Anaerolineales bacterium]